jgi:hypothetical protein
MMGRLGLNNKAGRIYFTLSFAEETEEEYGQSQSEHLTKGVDLRS